MTKNPTHKKPHQGKKPNHARQQDGKPRGRKQRSIQKPDTSSNAVLFGLHAVREAWLNPDRDIKNLYITDNALDGFKEFAQAEAKTSRAPVLKSMRKAPLIKSRAAACIRESRLTPNIYRKFPCKSLSPAHTRNKARPSLYWIRSQTRIMSARFYGQPPHSVQTASSCSVNTPAIKAFGKTAWRADHIPVAYKLISAVPSTHCRMRLFRCNG